MPRGGLILSSVFSIPYSFFCEEYVVTTRLILGCGYLGRRVASRWRERGEKVLAVTHAADRAGELAAAGLDPLVADVTRPDTLRNLPAADTVLYAVGYDRAGSASRREVLVDGLRAVLDALPRDTGRMIYISSTGVSSCRDKRSAVPPRSARMLWWGRAALVLLYGSRGTAYRQGRPSFSGRDGASCRKCRLDRL